MRDPNRIDEFCRVLNDCWKTKLPDWRFGQLMSNFLGYVWEATRKDVFFIEDDEMQALLTRFVAENT